MTNLTCLSNSIEQALSTEQQNKLRALLEQGLPLVKNPYLTLANKIKANEAQVLNQINAWQQQGLIKRFGLVVKHRALGYQANAMVVWDINSEEVDNIASQLAQRNEVSLCYRRPRQLPHWPYNLFCMIHGKCRNQVQQQIAQISQDLQLQRFNKAVLFSYKAFKQQGARYQQGNMQ